jgi:hypothetical protein
MNAPIYVRPDLRWRRRLAVNDWLLRHGPFIAALCVFGLLVLAWWSLPVLGNAIVAAMAP